MAEQPGPVQAESGASSAGSEDLIWHYTNSEGLIGILTEDKLWATDLRFLNDSSERRYSLDLLEEVVNEVRSGSSEDELTGVNQRWEWLKQMQAEIPLYAVCFARNRDDLNLWHNYAGRAYAIGLDRNIRWRNNYAWRRGRQAHDVEPPIPGRVDLRSVSYGKVGNEEKESLISALKDFQPGSGGKAFTDTMFLPMIASIKHPAFCSEGEERLIISSGAHGLGLHPRPLEPLFRPTTMGPTPYITVSPVRPSIQEVRVGPGPEQDLRILAAETLLKEVLPDRAIPVRGSAIPYRPTL
jgi:hypothetical protein